MENTLPCAHIPPLITAEPTASPGIIERCSLFQRTNNPAKETVGNSDFDNSIEDEAIVTSENGLDNSNFDFYPLSQSQANDINPESILDARSQSLSNDNNYNHISYYNNNSSFNDECGSVGRQRNSDPLNFHTISNFLSNNPVDGASGGNNGESLPSLESVDPNPGTARKWKIISSISASNNENCETAVNNLQAARPKETSIDANSSYRYHLPRYHGHNQYNHHHHHHHHYHHHSQQQINIPVHNNCSTSDNRRNTFSSVIQKDSSTSLKLHQPKLSKSLLSKSDTISSSQMAETSAGDITTTTTMMPYSNCTLFKQGPLVQINGPSNGNMSCSAKCYPLQQTNGLVMSSDFKTNPKMSQLQHVENQNQKKHSAVSNLDNYEGSLDAANSSKSDMLIQTKLKNAKQQQHTCKSLKYENNSNMNSVSNAPEIAVSCVNCNNCTNTNATTNSKLVGKKCKALYNLQCKFQKNRFISSLQDCCRACNSFDGCCGSGESFELETELLCPGYSYCDPDNVVHYNKDNNYKSQAGLCVEDHCIAGGSNTATLNSNNFRSNDLGSSGTGSIDNREEDFGDFIEADFPPVKASRLMSSSTDSTDSSLTSSDINETHNQQIVASINDIAILSHESNYSHLPNSNYFKNCDHKRHNQLSIPSPSTSNNSKCSENSCVYLTGFGDGNCVKHEQGSSVIKCSDVLKVSSSLLSSSIQSSPSTSPSSTTTTTTPSTLLLCTSDNQLPSNCVKKTKEIECCKNSHDSHHSVSDRAVTVPPCHNSFSAMQLPLCGATSNCQTSDNTVMSPEVDFLDFDIVSTTTPNLDSEQNLNSAGSSTSAMEMEFLDFELASNTTPNLEQNLNSAGSSTGAMGFEFSLSEIPYADDVDSACPSPTGDLLQMNANGSTPCKSQLTNCATNDLSASSSNSNLSALEDPTLPHSHSNFQNHLMTEKCFSNLNLDDQDDVSVDSEESGSHDSNEIGESDTHCRLAPLCLSYNGLQNNFHSSPSSPTSDDSDFRDIPGTQEPIYEDIDRILSDKCTAASPGDKCCCAAAASTSDTDHKTDSHAVNMQHSTKKKHSMSSRKSSMERIMIWDENQAYHRQVKRSESEVSACGPIAVLNMLNAFNIQLDKSKVLEKAPIHFRESTAPIPQYLFSRAKAGTTAEELIHFVESLTNGAIKGRFFDFYPPRDVHVLKWLGEWIKKDAVPIATLNIQKGVQPGWPIPDSWHHQMIYGVSSKGAYMTNPLKLVGEKPLMQQLTSNRDLLIKRQDIISRFNEDTNLSTLMCHEEPYRWRTMNVLGQVLNVLREARMLRVPGYRPQLTQHIRIPAAYRAGITLFVRADMDVYQHLTQAPNLPLLINLSCELQPLSIEDSNSADDASGCNESGSSSCGNCTQRQNQIDGCDGNDDDDDNCAEYENEGSDSATSTLVLPSSPVSSAATATAAAAAAVTTASSSSSFVSPPLPHLPDYPTGRQRYVVHGFPHRNNVYVPYFKS
ncbi:uncharacterized protein LOC115209365 isoform X1 [Argonauta hians]